MSAVAAATAALHSLPPKVDLVGSFAAPLNQSIAAARTCYSSRIVWPDEVGASAAARESRDRIAASTFAAGHHTIWQHVHFQFALQNVSRQLLWSFLHAHPFYNSEQVSQRYVRVGAKTGFVVPQLPSAELTVYQSCVAQQRATYDRLTELLIPTVEQAFFGLFPSRRKQVDAYRSSLRKRAQEVARAILPVATHAHLYHTISGITLFRYWQMRHSPELGTELSLLVEAMVAAVNQVDPLFLRHLETALPASATIEQQMLPAPIQTSAAARQMVAEFDAELGEQSVRLVDYSVAAPAQIGRSVRCMLGLSANTLGDDEIIDWLLNPQRNAYLHSSVDVAMHSKLMHALAQINYTFQKKLSHAADSQNQRHRTLWGSRPLLVCHYVGGQTDVVIPPLLQQAPQALECFMNAAQTTTAAIDRLLDAQIKPQDALYLLPNAFPVRFYETGHLLGLHHRAKARLCFNAQDEIWRATQQEALAVSKVHPQIGRWLLPPCSLRALGKARPICPEGVRYCGVPVWKQAVQDYQRVL